MKRSRVGSSVSLADWVKKACRDAAEAFLARLGKEARRFGTWEIWPFQSGLEFDELFTRKMEEVIVDRLRDGDVRGTVQVRRFWRVKGCGWTLGFRVTVSPVAKIAKRNKPKRTYWPVPRRHRAI